MYNLGEYGNNYPRTSGSLWQDYRDEPALTDTGILLISILLITVLRLNLNKI